MFNYLTDKLPDSYKGYKLNTSFRVALKIQELLEDPTIKCGDLTDKRAAYIVALSLLVDDYVSFLTDDSLGTDSVPALISWWLTCGDNDPVEEYWKRTGIVPDIGSNTFDKDDYNNISDDLITIEAVGADGKVKMQKVSKTAILEFDAPDGSIRYKKEIRGNPSLISLYEDSSLIYSAFYSKFHIDLANTDLHWFSFCSLLAEIEATEDTALASKMKIRSFDPADYQGKAYDKYRTKMTQARDKARVLGILPYNRKRA